MRHERREAAAGGAAEALDADDRPRPTPWWYRGRIKRMRGSIYMGDFNTGTLRRIRLNRAGTAVKSISLTYHAPSGIIDVSSGPRRWLYFATQTAIYRIVN